MAWTAPHSPYHHISFGSNEAWLFRHHLREKSEPAKCGPRKPKKGPPPGAVEREFPARQAECRHRGQGPTGAKPIVRAYPYRDVTVSSPDFRRHAMFPADHLPGRFAPREPDGR